MKCYHILTGAPLKSAFQSTTILTSESKMAAQHINKGNSNNVLSILLHFYLYMFNKLSGAQIIQPLSVDMKSQDFLCKISLMFLSADIDNNDNIPLGFLTCISGVMLCF